MDNGYSLPQSVIYQAVCPLPRFNARFHSPMFTTVLSFPQRFKNNLTKNERKRRKFKGIFAVVPWVASSPCGPSGRPHERRLTPDCWPSMVPSHPLLLGPAPGAQPPPDAISQGGMLPAM